MSLFALIGLFAGILLITLLAALIAKNTGKLGSFNYRSKAPMTAVERKLYYTIREALKHENVIILAQVNMTGFIQCDRKNWKAFNRICRKSIDFLICDREAAPLVAIELQDKTHDKPDRKKSDQTKAEVLETAHMPLVLFWTTSFPDVATVRKTLEPFISRTRTKR